eukprot:scaffold8374_cov175-Amphora_coffeaeformis.AAC.105
MAKLADPESMVPTPTSDRSVLRLRVYLKSQLQTYKTPARKQMDLWELNRLSRQSGRSLLGYNGH